MPQQQFSPLQDLDGLFPDHLAIFCPIPLTFHPSGPSAYEEPAARWAVGHQLCTPGSRMTRAGFGRFIAAGMPHITGEAGLAMTYYTYWALLWDDHLDSFAGNLAPVIELTAEANRVMYEPAAAPLSDDKWLTSLRDLRGVMERCLSPDGMEMVRSENTQWMGAQLWKLAMQQRTAPPSVGEYLRMRWPKCGAGPLAAYTAPGAGYLLSPAELYDPAVRAFTLSVFHPCTIINDLMSLFKEESPGQRQVNILTAVATEGGLGLPDALFRVWELYERMVGVMLRLQQRLLVDPRPAVARYAAELPQWIPSTIDFSANSARYLETRKVSFTPPAITMSDTPFLWDQSDLTPPPYPDIAWWWQQCTR
ncbi:terpene synthase family protein [Streptomyces sp. HF10]|uniref:terpene synthase family protein n=1 Tax=Streptomyces sp. HF10 TaxID=2692233 RepID=UPI0013186669|nr:hypothetical protein [Streptomyces sp. HF10]QHC27531.1 hypothetical protein GR129_00310 [Streptomyces sp. HF10]